ncbi:uncharacterized protein PODANS_7_4700 [Podospora anserina S mat+]|uniref:Podospora anserina S mat+ genomic DNA chromosome 7, supercontig 1 n=1 Tax=Podospora anserina (strain S / ATCC MYA-4624 / DSM 980 / FGSC 10383) TaxID=515849 RepID=B2AUY4_PODAN|nr:uncharacterized protein PODANS_7_4700 [Podospora anserina S mat+]CAP68207.1 unnamed protein product [Podospora anserina S mat+]CDP31677.1 Putative protein of unknown function [Podospora anserina S mat+]
MSLFLDRRLYLERFQQDRPAQGDEYGCTLLQWPGATTGTLCRDHLTRATEITAFPESELTIVLAPIDDPSPDSLAGFEALVERYDIPGAFLEERTQGVLNSFGYIPEGPGSYCVWTHFLLKDIERNETSGAIEISTKPQRKPLNTRLVNYFRRMFLSSKAPTTTSAQQFEMHQPRMSYIETNKDDADDYLPSWTSRSFFLRVTNHGGNNARITLLCFEPSPFLEEELVNLPQRIDCSQIMANPFILLEMIMYDLYMQLDINLWELRDIFQVEQKHFGYLTANPTLPLADIDFSALHLLADYIIMLREGCHGLLSTVDAIVDHYQKYSTVEDAILRDKTYEAFKYRRRLVASTSERAGTFEKRINNLTTLFFNHISQQDNAMLMRDSSSVKAIAVVTLVFLPITTVATVCGSEFFYTRSEGGIRMDPTAWIMFGLSAVLSLVLLWMWNFYTQSLEEKFARGRRRAMNGRGKQDGKLVFSA